jgi:hypothetical protein
VICNVFLVYVFTLILIEINKVARDSHASLGVTGFSDRGNIPLGSDMGSLGRLSRRFTPHNDILRKKC